MKEKQKFIIQSQKKRGKHQEQEKAEEEENKIGKLP